MKNNDKLKEVVRAIKNKKNVLEIKKKLESVLTAKAIAAVKKKEKQIARTMFSESTSKVDVMMKLKEIAESKKIRSVVFNDGNSLAVDAHTATTILEAYDKTDKKEKFTEMANKSEKSFLVLVDYSFRKTNSL